MIDDHDVNLHFGYWLRAIEGKLRGGADPVTTVMESAEEIAALILPTSAQAHAEIRRVAEASTAFLKSGQQDETTRTELLNAVHTLRRSLRPNDFDTIRGALRPPI